MRQLVFDAEPTHPIVFLVPALREQEIRREYLECGIPEGDVRCLPLHFDGKKTPVARMKQYLADELLPAISEDPGVRYLVVADAGYFRLLSGLDQAEPNLGYVLDCPHGPWKVLYVPSFRTVFYDPRKVRTKITSGLNALLAHVRGDYQDPGDGIVKFEAYPETDEEIAAWLEKLLGMDCDLAIDTETFDLKHHRAGLGTITFCWSKHEGIALPIDYVEMQGPRRETGETLPRGVQVRNETRRALLRSFFLRFRCRALYHNISYDVYNLVYQLFMTDVLDTEGMLRGMEILLRNWDDTQLIIYLATNSCAGNELGLKPNSQEFSGNYSIEVTDITTQPLRELLRYNLVDGLSTWFVFEKFRDRMVQDQQLEIYEQLFKPSIRDIIQMQLTGLPLDMKRVGEVKTILQAIRNDAVTRLRATQTLQQFTHQLREKHVQKRNSELKKKRISMQDAETQAVEFNPNSDDQLRDLLYGMLGLPVIDVTKTKLPSTGGDTLEKLLHRTKSQDVKDFLQGMLDYIAVDKLLGSFIPAFEDAMPGPDGWHYLVGKFRLGGTLSGRLSSSDPNLQNLPANVEMLLTAAVLAALLARFPEIRHFVKKGKLHLGKLVKSCFSAPPGWLMCGLDFNALEDRISALTTKDPNKIKVYTDGYDGHSLRAFAYFGDQMPDIDPSTPEGINKIAKLYPEKRTFSKRPTFALTYQGTWMTLVKNLGFEEKQAKELEARYKVLYKVSIDWVQGKLDQAAKDGYITAAFGLRIRTPLLAQVVRGNSKTPHEAEAEGRSAGNALGQSWCLLTNRASVEFLTTIRAGPHRLDIRPCAHIHDAQYMLVRDDAGTLLYANKHLVKAVQWQEHPDIRHPDVHLGGVFSVFWPDWSWDIEIPNGADEATLVKALEARLEKRA